MTTTGGKGRRVSAEISEIGDVEQPEEGLAERPTLQVGQFSTVLLDKEISPNSTYI